MSTVLDLLEDSALLLGALDVTESLDANIAKKMFRRLKSMLDSWSTEGLMVYTFSRNVYPLTIGKASYTLGPGGDFNATRPIWIDRASVIPTASAPTLEIPVDILSDQEWQGVTIKSIQSNFPVQIHPRGDYPQNTIDVWPIPTASASLVLYVPSALQILTNLSDTISLPPGYEEAIVNNLACNCSSMYGTQPAPTVMKAAQAGKDLIRSQNLVVETIQCDSSMCGYGNGPTEQAIRSKGYVVD